MRTRLRSMLPDEPLVLGLGSVLLPCGALYAALLAAAATASAAQGAALMLGFVAISGVPLWGIGWLSQRSRRLRSMTGRRFVGALMLAGALVLAWRPLPQLRAQLDVAVEPASAICGPFPLHP